MIGQDQEDWREWLSEAHTLIAGWETATSMRLLSINEAADLAERIARALHHAYERGRRQPSAPAEHG